MQSYIQSYIGIPIYNPIRYMYIGIPTSLDPPLRGQDPDRRAVLLAPEPAPACLLADCNMSHVKATALQLLLPSAPRRLLREVDRRMPSLCHRLAGREAARRRAYFVRALAERSV